MKKIFFLLVLLTTQAVNSQIIRSAIDFDGRDNQIDVRLKKNNKFVNGFINNIGTDIWKNFSNRFKKLSDVHWYVDENEITAYFICDSENVMIKYKPNGSLIWIRKVYEGNMLDTLIASFIDRGIEKRFVIDLVTELIIGEQTIYEISLKHEKELCFLQILRDDSRNELKIIDKMVSNRDD